MKSFFELDNFLAEPPKTNGTNEIAASDNKAVEDSNNVNGVVVNTEPSNATAPAVVPEEQLPAADGDNSPEHVVVVLFINLIYFCFLGGDTRRCW